MLESLLVKYEEALECGAYYDIRSIQNEVIDYVQNYKSRFFNEIFNVDEDLELTATCLFYHLIEYKVPLSLELAYCFATNVIRSGLYSDEQERLAYKYRAYTIVFNPNAWDDPVWEACSQSYYSGSLERDNVYDILILGDVLMARGSDPNDKKLADLEKQIPNILHMHPEIHSEVHAIKESALGHRALYTYCVDRLKKFC